MTHETTNLLDTHDTRDPTNPEQLVEVEVPAGDGWLMVNGCATLLHELVQLSHEMIFLLPRLVIRFLRDETGLCEGSTRHISFRSASVSVIVLYYYYI